MHLCWHYLDLSLLGAGFCCCFKTYTTASFSALLVLKDSSLLDWLILYQGPQGWVDRTCASTAVLAGFPSALSVPLSHPQPWNTAASRHGLASLPQPWFHLSGLSLCFDSIIWCLNATTLSGGALRVRTLLEDLAHSSQMIEIPILFAFFLWELLWHFIWQPVVLWKLWSYLV